MKFSLLFMTIHFSGVKGKCYDDKFLLGFIYKYLVLNGKCTANKGSYMICFIALHRQLLLFLRTFQVIWTRYRWVPLKPDFLGAWKSVRLKHYPAYPVIIVSLIIQKNLATKIRAMRESGLTAVWLKRDPPVLHSLTLPLGKQPAQLHGMNNS